MDVFETEDGFAAGLAKARLHGQAGMRAEILAPVPAGKSLVVAGWALGSDGRKHRSATAILAPEGRVLARAEALWIRLRS